MKHGVWIPSYLRRRAWGSAAGLGLFAMLAAPATAQDLDHGLLWSSPPASGESWNPNTVSIGNYGTQVFSQLWSYDTYAKLYSAHDSGAAPAVWTRSDPAYSTKSSADSATFEDIHVGMYQYYLSGISGPQAARVTAYRSDSSAPEWEYTMPVSISNHTATDAWVSRDAQVVLAYSHNSAQNKVEVAVFRPLDSSFDPTNPTPVHYSSLPGAATLRGGDFSADGSTLVLSYSPYTKVYDTGSGEEVFSQSVAVGDTVTESVAVSGDGQYFARGIVSGFQVYRRVSQGNYTLAFEHIISTLSVCTALDISDDGTTVVAGYALLPGASVRVQAVDILSQDVTADKSFYGGGSLDNRVSDIAVSADGEFFVAGFWGDGDQSVPELVSFRSSSSNPIGVYDQPGSVVDVDISYDGRRFAAGVREFHVNIGGSDGRIECYNLIDHDMGVEGVPSRGNTVTFRWKTPSSATNAVLLRSRHLANAPATLPGVAGSLYLPRAGMTFLPGTISNGIASRQYTIPGAQAVVGSSFYFQGFSGDPRTLTEDWIKLTILP